MFYKLLIACSLTFKSKLSVAGSGKTSPPQKNKKTDVKFLLNLLNSNVFQSHGLERKRKFNVFFPTYWMQVLWKPSLSRICGIYNQNVQSSE